MADNTLTFKTIDKSWQATLNDFLLQSHTGELKTSIFPKEYEDLRMKVSFGMGAPARVPWIGFLAPEMQISNSINPVYLYYKDLHMLILAYGVSETVKSEQMWPAEIMNSTQTINALLDKGVPRYGDSFVFKAYKVETENDQVICKYFDSGEIATEKDIESDLNTIIEYYKKVVSAPSSPMAIEVSQGLFYMEKQLEDFIIFNWDNTDLGKKYDLIVEEGVPVSQQYPTGIGPIDILAIDKVTKDYVVIELKRNQTSDDTVGQLARYMGWIKEIKGGNVKGVIIAGTYDKKLDYALKVMTGVEVFLYQVDFKLNQFVK